MTKQFRNIHIYLSLFFLPLALMYALTGILYICGFDQDSGATKTTYTLHTEIQQGGERDAILQFLADNQLKIPSNSEIRTKRGVVLMGSPSYEVSLIKTSDSNYTITTLQRSIIGNMIMLHKAKAKWYFDVLAIGFGITLILLYISGLMITLFNSKKNRGIQSFTILAGIIISTIVGILSVA